MKKRVLINRTSSFCFECWKTHPAYIEREGQKIIFRMECNYGEKEVIISNDADLFLTIRNKKSLEYLKPFGYRGFFRFRYIDITGSCNFRCPICFAEAGRETNHKSISEIKPLLMNAKKTGASFVILTGGEPILHPEIERIIKIIRRMGMRSIILSNGLILAKNPEFIKRLKRAGLWGITIQFDTFNENVHMKMRANRYVKEKTKAIQYVLNSGLSLSLTMVVSNLNLRETGKMVRYALSLNPPPNSLNIVSLNRIGRALQTNLSSPTREEIISAILEDMKDVKVKREDFWPFPTYYPWKTAMHPDCGALLWLIREKEKFYPLGLILNIGNVFRNIERYRGKENIYSTVFYPFAQLIKATSHPNRFTLLKSLFGTITGRGEKSILTVLIGDFLHRDYMDIERLKGCAACYTTPKQSVPACFYVYREYYKRRKK